MHIKEARYGRDPVGNRIVPPSFLKTDFEQKCCNLSSREKTPHISKGKKSYLALEELRTCRWSLFVGFLLLQNLMLPSLVKVCSATHSFFDSSPNNFTFYPSPQFRTRHNTPCLVCSYINLPSKGCLLSIATVIF